MNKDSFPGNSKTQSEEKKSSVEMISDLNSLDPSSASSQPNSARWINNKGEEVDQVFGFNENAELVNGRAAMFGFLMLVLTEFAFGGLPVTRTIFGLG